VNTRRILPAIVLLPAFLTLSACNESTKAHEGQADINQNKVTGEAYTIASASLDRSYDGAIRAINSLQFKIEKQAKDALKGVITARTADNTSVSVDLTRKSDAITAISVTAGPLEQSLAKTVLEKIQGELK
jgi:hypothetical protein